MLETLTRIAGPAAWMAAILDEIDFPDNLLQLPRSTAAAV
jgi:hypothetical protein